MKKKLCYISCCCMIMVTLLTGLILTVDEKDVYASYKRYVTASSLVIRKSASSKGKKVGSYTKGKKITCYGTKGKWTKVKYGGYYRYVSTQYLSSTKPVTIYYRYVTASSLIIRAKASTSSSKIGNYAKGTKVACYGTSGSWTKIKYGGVYRYIKTSYLSSTKPITSTTTSVTGTSVVNYALQFVGNPYKWGGESLTNGADCSGFTLAVFKYFGYTLPHNSISQRSYGTAISWANKAPGDLICYNAIDGVGHVGIYIGNNQVVHAGSTATGIHVSTADYRSVNCVRRILK